MEAAPGKRDELIEAFRVRSPEARQEPGCEEYELYQSTERPDLLMLVERWSDEASLAVHAELNKQRSSKGESANLGSLRAGPSRAERYTIPE